MDSFLKILKYGFILCLLSPLTTASSNDEVDVQLLDNQNAPLVATLDLSKANKRVKQYVDEAVITKMKAVKENVKDYVSDIEKKVSVNIKDEIRIIVEEIFKEKGYNNFTAAVNDNTDTILYVHDQQKQISARFNSLENLINTTVKEKAKPKECADIGFIQNGIFVIYPSGENKPKRAYCVLQDNIKWTVIQRRFDFSVNFTRSWNEYKEGFGEATGEHWLGNEYINAITTEGQHKARFMLEKDGKEKYAEYSNFRVEDEQSKYMLKVSGYSGTAGESLYSGSSARWSNGQKFSTYDQDNDGSIHSCAVTYKGGWWYNHCYYAALNNMDKNRIDWGFDMGLKLDKSLVLITKD